MKYGALYLRPYRGRYSQSTLQSLREEIITYLGHEDKIATGRLIRSVHISGMGVGIEVPYMVYIEFGQRRHLAPIKPLIKWAMARFGSDYRMAKRIAYAVQRKINFVGVKPTFLIHHALEDLGFEIVDKYFSGNITVFLIRRKKRMRMTEKFK